MHPICSKKVLSQMKNYVFGFIKIKCGLNSILSAATICYNKGKLLSVVGKFVCERGKDLIKLDTSHDMLLLGCISDFYSLQSKKESYKILIFY